MLGCLGRMVRESREATKTYTLLINTLHIRILYNTEEKICEFLQPRQKLAGWPGDRQFLLEGRFRGFGRAQTENFAVLAPHHFAHFVAQGEYCTSATHAR